MSSTNCPRPDPPAILPVRAIDRSSSEPIHSQIYERLRDNIIRGVWKPGDQLPTEPQLMAHFQVSRITVRQAYDKLVSQNLVFRQQGRGTFVCHPSIETNATRIISFTDDMEQRGMKPGTRLLAAKIVPASGVTADRLGIHEGDELAMIMRLRLANDEVISLEESFLVHRYCPGIVDHYDFSQTSLRRVLDKDYDVRLVRASQTVQAVAALEDLPKLLAVTRGSPLLYIKRISYAQDSLPIEYLRIFYRADRYALHHELNA